MSAMYTPAGRGNPPIRSRAKPEDHSHVRVFFAVQPPADLRRTLGAVARIAAHEARGRAVPDDNLHLTLVFVGDVVASMLPALSRIGASAAARGGGVTLVLDRLGAFARARVAWLGPSSVPEPLVTLAHALERELDAAGVAGIFTDRPAAALRLFGADPR
jgi:2'-5' RNA ligase